MPIQCTCRTCGAIFATKPSDIRAGGGKFCSPTCYWQQPDLTADEQWALLLSRGVRSGTCLLWLGRDRTAQYGRVRINGQTHAVHRLSYVLSHGPIPDGFQIQHLCNTPRCFEPPHLVAGTPAQNSAYMVACGRSGDGSSHIVPEKRARGARHGSRIHPERLERGERRYNAKLTDEGVRDMRRRFAAGETIAALAQEYGVAMATAQGAIHRKTWAHVS
jgi:hypothetical protein